MARPVKIEYASALNNISVVYNMQAVRIEAYAVASKDVYVAAKIVKTSNNSVLAT